MSTTAPAVILESGDRLNREEFHRRYCLRPDIRKAELVQGVVYVASPVRHSVHGKQHGQMIGWFYVYTSRATGLQLSDNATVFLDPETEVQPDCCLFRDPPPGPAAARITPEGYIEGTPQLVVEIAASSASHDLHDKLEAYRRAGVLEYIVWRVLDMQIDWFRLHGDEYVRITPDARGVIESSGFPGLRLHVAKMIAGDAAGVLAELEPPAML